MDLRLEDGKLVETKIVPAIPEKTEEIALTVGQLQMHLKAAQDLKEQAIASLEQANSNITKYTDMLYEYDVRADVMPPYTTNNAGTHTSTWTKAKLKDWLKNHNISFKSSDKEHKLLVKIIEKLQ